MSQKYRQDKIKPFIEEISKLKEQLKILETELSKEEQENDRLFQELVAAEKELDHIQEENLKLQAELLNKTDGAQNDKADQNKEIDRALDEKVKYTLSDFLFTEGRQDYYLEKQQELEKRENTQGQNTKANNSQMDISQHSANQEQEENDETYKLRMKYKEKENVLPISVKLQNFEQLKPTAANFCQVSPDQVFFKDQLGNIILFHMNLLEQLFPRVYDLLRNYEPMVEIEVRRPNIKEEQPIIFNNDDDKVSEKDAQDDMMVNLNPLIGKKVDWQSYLKWASKLKYFFESCLFLTMLIFFIIVQLDSQQYIINNQLYQSLLRDFNIKTNYMYPDKSLIGLINSTIPSEEQKGWDHQIYPTMVMKKGLVVQQLVMIKPIEDCIIFSDKQKKQLEAMNQSCLDYELAFNGQLNNTNSDDGKFQSETEQYDPSEYNSHYGGYVWELDLNNQSAFTQTSTQMVEQGWLQFNRQQTQYIINYYNAPTNRIIQVNLNIKFLFYDEYLNYNTVSVTVLQLSDYNDQQKQLNVISFYISIILLIFSVFGKYLTIIIDFFSIYLINTDNAIIKAQKEYRIKMNEIKKIQKSRKGKNYQMDLNDKAELKNKQLVFEDYWILNLKVAYLVIRKPLIFDYIYMFSFLMIIAYDNVFQNFLKQANQIVPSSVDFQDITDLDQAKTVLKVYSSLAVLFLMISVIRFLGNWSEYLRCYGVVIVRFTKQSWFIILVLIYILAMCSLCFIISQQASVPNYTNFIFVFLGLIRSTLRYSIPNDIGKENLYQTVKENVSFQFSSRYIQYILIVVITLVMFPIFVSLMTQEVHNTKQEAKQKSQELENQRIKQQGGKKGKKQK